jgi:hypothetical protein
MKLTGHLLPASLSCMLAAGRAARCASITWGDVLARSG